MNLLEARRDLEKLGRSAFHIKEAAAALGINSAHACQVLKRLQDKEMALSLKRGIWALSKDIDPFLVPEALSFPYQSYISFHTALNYHGLIEQIPEVIYVASLGRTTRISTPVGTFSFHHLEPVYFGEFERIGPHRIPMASSEKALFDYLYLSFGNSKWFKKLPELDVPSTFDKKKILKWSKAIKSNARREHVMAALKNVFK